MSAVKNGGFTPEVWFVEASRGQGFSMASQAAFGMCFIGQSTAISSQIFQQVDPTHWVLEVGDKFQNLSEVKDIVLFLTAPDSLGPDKGLGLYVKTGSVSDWGYRGFVSSAHPSEVIPLQLHIPTGVQSSVQIGVSVELLDELTKKETDRLGAKEDFAKRVAQNLYHFMTSFGTMQAGDKVVVPANCFERWFTRFQEKYRRDPDFLTRGGGS
ncbi:hypothetical protein BSKO_00421 [Bryopsis sp. KO-2023]|nr:hypothetical protein BSKO_00421 [Bryopsis sp. KO-2023]